MEDLKVMLGSKADKNEIIELHAKKCNKVDQELGMGFIETIHNQLSHVAVILKELLKASVSSSPSSEMEKMGKLTYLSNQADHVCSWIDKFDQ